MSNKQPSFLKANAVTEENRKKLMIPNESPTFSSKDIDVILKHAVENGVSDINLQVDQPVIFQIYGKIEKVSRHNLSVSELNSFITQIFGDGAVTTLNGGMPLDAKYFFKDEDDKNLTYRFRVNATKGEGRGVVTYQLTARVIPDNIPLLEEMNLPKDLEYALLNFRKGIALVTGATGSGKSTLLASIIAEFLRNEKYHKKIITAEAPIEFTYDKIQSKHSFVHQSSIPHDLPSFSVATSNALRRAPNIILVGEARDPATIRESTIAAMTGHEVYTTVHSNGFIETFRRMIEEFPANERAGAAAALIGNTKVVLSQQLVPSKDGKRVALREYVIINDEIKEILLGGGIEKLTFTSKKVLEKYGHSFVQDAKEKHEQGLISDEVYHEIVNSAKAVYEGEEKNALKENMEVEILNSIKEIAKMNALLLQKIIDQDEKIAKQAFLLQNMIETKEVDLNF